MCFPEVSQGLLASIVGDTGTDLHGAITKPAVQYTKILFHQTRQRRNLGFIYFQVESRGPINVLSPQAG